mmetsp:Transcript_4359/g.18448  ORF Transcript_4359/g.18448 Transcript_4359/m.18448 type:complete len:302 (+) Transcript_4359:2554-3459(+)
MAQAQRDGPVRGAHSDRLRLPAGHAGRHGQWARAAVGAWQHGRQLARPRRCLGWRDERHRRLEQRAAGPVHDDRHLDARHPLDPTGPVRAWCGCGGRLGEPEHPGGQRHHSLAQSGPRLAVDEDSGGPRVALGQVLDRAGPEWDSARMASHAPRAAGRAPGPAEVRAPLARGSALRADHSRLALLPPSAGAVGAAALQAASGLRLGAGARQRGPRGRGGLVPVRRRVGRGDLRPAPGRAWGQSGAAVGLCQPRPASPDIGPRNGVRGPPRPGRAVADGEGQCAHLVFGRRARGLWLRHRRR